MGERQQGGGKVGQGDVLTFDVKSQHFPHVSKIHGTNLNTMRHSAFRAQRQRKP